MFFAVQWTRSLLFTGQMYLMMAIIGTAYAPFAAVNRKWAYVAVHNYCNWVRWTASWMVGLKSEIRGKVPTDEVLLASKHQSFFDIILIVSVIPKPKFIMKASLKNAPFLGWYAAWLKCVPVDRGKKAEAIQKMLQDVTHGDSPPGQLVIYPQGTRVAPGATKPYKIGTFALYEETGQTVIPAATNVGVFWPRLGIYRKPGLAVVEFLEPISPGLEKEEFMSHLEDVIETKAKALMNEAGFKVD